MLTLALGDGEGREEEGNVWDLLSPPLVVEETEGSNHDEQHEPHRGDSEEDAQAPSIFFLWWWKGGIDRLEWKLLLWQHWRTVMGRPDSRQRAAGQIGEQVRLTWTSDVEGDTVCPGAIASQ